MELITNTTNKTVIIFTETETIITHILNLQLVEQSVYDNRATKIERGKPERETSKKYQEIKARSKHQHAHAALAHSIRRYGGLCANG